MNIEPLKTLLSFSNNKKMCIYEFLSPDIQSKIEVCNYQEDEFFINDYIYCIKRNTLELEVFGRIFLVEKDKIGIHKSTYMNVYIDPKKYYLFIKNSNNLKNKREFLKELLNNI